MSKSKYFNTVVNENGQTVVCPPQKYQKYIHNTIVTDMCSKDEIEKGMEVAVKMIEDDIKSGDICKWESL